MVRQLSDAPAPPLPEGCCSAFTQRPSPPSVSPAPETVLPVGRLAARGASEGRAPPEPDSKLLPAAVADADLRLEPPPANAACPGVCGPEAVPLVLPPSCTTNSRLLLALAPGMVCSPITQRSLDVPRCDRIKRNSAIDCDRINRNNAMNCDMMT